MGHLCFGVKKLPIVLILLKYEFIDLEISKKHISMSHILLSINLFFQYAE